MTKHLRTALRLAGLKLSQVVITQNPHGHPHITIGSTGKTVVCSSTPRSPETASKLIARDLRRALG
jgi:hypothetical protein